MPSESPVPGEQTLPDIQRTANESARQQVPTQATSTYRDHSLVAPTTAEVASDGQDVQRFPEKLFHMLERAGEEGFDHVISWQPHGRCFVIHRREAFQSMLPTLMPGMTQLKSFQRQLRLWGFKRVTDGRDVDGYYHEIFLRYRPHLLHYMRRRDPARSLDITEVPPDFYTMPFLTPLQSGSAGRGHNGTSTRIHLESAQAVPAGFQFSQPRSLPTISVSDRYSYGPLDHSNGSSIGARQESLAGMNPAIEGNLGGGMLQFSTRSVPESSAAASAPSQLFGNQRLDAIDHPSGSDVSQGTFMDRPYNYQQIHADDHQGKTDPNLEPRPLPPVTTLRGGMILHLDQPVTVAMHPGFVQIGPQEYYYSSTGGEDDNEQQEPPSRQPPSRQPSR
jgi:HSF-type DNA-binding